MGKIVITTNISLDGVAQDPTGEEGFSLGGWFYQYGGHDLEQWAEVETEEARGAVAVLLGMSASSVKRLAAAGEIPAPLRLGHLRRWSKAAIESWIERQTKEQEMASA